MSLRAVSEPGVYSDGGESSHRFSGKTPIEVIIQTMKELVEYNRSPICAIVHANL